MLSFFKSNSLQTKMSKMSETKSKSKSKNRNRQVKTDPYDLQCTSTDTNNNTISKYISSGPSLLEKLDLEHLQQISFSAIKPSAGAAAQPRDAYIDYALDMVINNLIVNGHLDPTKATQIRTPLMKSQIASMCEKMVTVKGNKELTKKKLSEMSRSKPKVQKWAVQPTSLPITIITNQAPSGSGLVALEALKKSESLKLTGEFITGEKPKKTTKSKKSKKMASVCNAPPPEVSSKLTPLISNNTYRPDRPSSEVPSSISIDKNMSIISSNNILENSDNKYQKNVHFKGSELFKSELNQASVAQSQARASSSNKTDSESGGTTGTVMMPLFQPPSNEIRAQSPELSSCCSSTKTLNSFISSRSSLVSAKGFQILVDMKEFSNEEISMEVEDRKLIFLGSRSKRNGLNVRKVTEIVEVPKAVVMENLKIGRRVDGYVIVEEHDNDSEQ